MKTKLIEDTSAFMANPDNNYLISCPRSGSHWLRAVMELYFHRPILRRTFYYFDRTDYLLMHEHDMRETMTPRNVIYLHRDPVSVVFSWLMYEKISPIASKEQIVNKANLWGRHLHRWLVTEDFTVKKTVITFEAFQKIPRETFAFITAHFGQPLYGSDFSSAYSMVTKKELQAKLEEIDPGWGPIINDSKAYDTMRNEFRETHSDLIWEVALKDREEILKYTERK